MRKGNGQEEQMSNVWIYKTFWQIAFTLLKEKSNLKDLHINHDN